jgi:hypothetical protein
LKAELLRLLQARPKPSFAINYPPQIETAAAVAVGAAISRLNQAQGYAP